VKRFKCPKCGSNAIRVDAPQAQRCIVYDQNEQELSRSVDLGPTLENQRCADCGHAVVLDEWRVGRPPEEVLNSIAEVCGRLFRRGLASADEVRQRDMEVFDEIVDILDGAGVLQEDELELCRFCDHFVERNEYPGDPPGLVRHVHMDDGETVYRHDATPSGDRRTITEWRKSRPDLFPQAGEEAEAFLARRKRQGHHLRKQAVPGSQEPRERAETALLGIVRQLLSDVEKLQRPQWPGDPGVDLGLLPDPLVQNMKSAMLVLEMVERDLERYQEEPEPA